jgi:hypothetical protein
VRFRKSRGSTTQEVHFWADMHTSDLKTEFVYWQWQLHSLAPADRRATWPERHHALDRAGRAVHACHLRQSGATVRRSACSRVPANCAKSRLGVNVCIG